MYKVFINEHLVQLFEKEQSSNDNSTVFSLREPSCDELRLLVDSLLKEKEKMEVQLLFTKPKEGFEMMKNCFHFIEAAGGLVINDNLEVLMIFRLNHWDLPKGKLESGESESEAAIREVEEECGIDRLEIIEELPSTYHIYFQKHKRYFKRTYWFKMKTDSSKVLKPQSEEGIEKVEWVSKEDLLGLKDKIYASLRPLLT